MSEVTENGKTFKQFIKDYSFVIPDYQRAYSWGEKQITPFINDVLEHIDDNDDPSDDTKYYLGHYILENSTDENIFEIIDGQQRITTVYLFLLVCGYFNKNKEIYNFIKFLPVTYDREGLENIKSILESNEDVNNKLKILLTFEKTMSLARMVIAVQIFIDAFEGKIKKLDFEKIEKYVKVIFDAHCSVALFKDKAVASQIFELHNTRGIALSETEKVKALLMKSVYINSENPDKEIEVIQEAFAKVFKMEEKASENWLRGDMPLDTVLMYHLRAVEDGVKVENFGSPQWFDGDKGSFEYIKESLSNKTKEEIVTYAKNIAKEFAKSMAIITIEIPNIDTKENNYLIGDILLLDKTKSLIFLLRAFRASNTIDNKLIKRWENFVLSYDIIYWNGFFYGKQYRGDFDSIYASLKPELGFEECKNLLFEYYDGNGKSFGPGWGHLGENTKKLFEDGKNKWLSNTYGWTRAGYFLYKYEIQNGANVEKIRTDIFKDDKVSIDHIVARGLTWKSLGFEDYEKLSEEDDRKTEANKLRKEISVVINGIGNLALSTASNNSSDSNGLPKEHFGTFEKCGFIETAKQVETWVDPKQFASKINKRSEDIIKFISEKIINQDDIWK
ncbi:Domain of unknown function DUF262 [Flavobacteriaceae bacterium]